MLLQTKNLNYKVNNTEILKDVNISIEKQDMCAILGPNGAGKSTLVEILSKMKDKTSGDVIINSNKIENYKIKEFAKKVAYVPQIINFDYEFTVQDVVLMGVNPYKKLLEDYNNKDIEQAYIAMKKTNIFDLKDRSIVNLSGGERQRLAIARALMQKTDIIILDEPISNLDIYQQLEILNLLQTLNKDGKTIICVIHDINAAIKYFKTVILMEQGQVIKQGSIDDIISKSSLDNLFKIHVDIIQNNNQKVVVY